MLLFRTYPPDEWELPYLYAKSAWICSKSLSTLLWTVCLD